jgi:hypothetical protein
MPRSRENRKAPDIDILARHYLAKGLSKHPDIAKHVERVEDVEQMGMWSLLDLARKMGVDANSLIRATEADERALSDYSFRHPAFRGEMPFDLTISLLGHTVTRKAKVVFTHTPEWPYFDLWKQAEFTGWPMSSYHIEVEAVPEEHDEDENCVEGETEWLQLEDMTKDGVVPTETRDAVLDAVDEHCKREDASRRKAAAAKATSPTRRGRRRH